MPTTEKQIINNMQAKEHLPEILRHAITQADYLPDNIRGNQIAINRLNGEEVILPPLAFKVYTVAIFAHDVLWELNELSKVAEIFPVTREKMREQHQKMYEDNHAIFYAAREWFIEYYINEYMRLLD
tara:strand:- start:21367 stop:21747 length:381 start_codon:yes stop_codon:yes gene_type:complete